MGGVPEHFNFPWQLAQDYGFFEKENIDFKWSFYSAGTGAMVKALEAGELDMAILLTEGAVSAIIKGLQAKIVKQYITSPLIWGIHTGNHSGIENIGACEGKQYAISRFGSGSHLMAMIDAEVRNKKIEEKAFVLVENMPGAIQSLEANESQVFFWEKYTTKPNVDNGFLRRIGEFITPWSCFQIVASNQILEQHPEKVEAILKTINFTCKQFMTADNSIDMILTHFDMKPEDALAWFYSTEWNTDYTISEKMLENVMYALRKIGNIQQEMKPKELVGTNVKLI
jgi:ABC-type nitrate/sulfonate/bicarbonate transport system substrate-binding protein